MIYRETQIDKAIQGERRRRRRKRRKQSHAEKRKWAREGERKGTRKARQSKEIEIRAVERKSGSPYSQKIRAPLLPERDKFNLSIDGPKGVP